MGAGLAMAVCGEHILCVGSASGWTSELGGRELGMGRGKRQGKFRVGKEDEGMEGVGWTE